MHGRARRLTAENAGLWLRQAATANDTRAAAAARLAELDATLLVGDARRAFAALGPVVALPEELLDEVWLNVMAHLTDGALAALAGCCRLLRAAAAPQWRRRWEGGWARLAQVDAARAGGGRAAVRRLRDAVLDGANFGALVARAAAGRACVRCRARPHPAV